MLKYFGFNNVTLRSFYPLKSLGSLFGISYITAICLLLILFFLYFFFSMWTYLFPPSDSPFHPPYLCFSPFLSIFPASLPPSFLLFLFSSIFLSLPVRSLGTLEHSLCINFLNRAIPQRPQNQWLHLAAFLQSDY